MTGRSGDKERSARDYYSNAPTTEDYLGHNSSAHYSEGDCTTGNDYSDNLSTAKVDVEDCTAGNDYSDNVSTAKVEAEESDVEDIPEFEMVADPFYHAWVSVDGINGHVESVHQTSSSKERLYISSAT